MGSRHYAYASAPKQQAKKTQSSPSFTPEPPRVQAKAEDPQQKLPEWNPDASIFQTDLDNPYAGLFGSLGPTTAAASIPIQAKLTVGAVGDKYEQEADTVAANVVKAINQPQGAVQKADEQTQIGDKSVQRQPEEEEEVQMKPQETLQREGMEEEEIQMKPNLQRVGKAGGAVDSGLESQINSAKGNGQPLDAGLQQSMGQTMGADFSGVKVHTDSQSNQLNESIQSKAFTTGSDVFFRSGEYDPGSKGGQELIAHELTHVVQQSGSSIRRTLDPEKEAQFKKFLQQDEDQVQTKRDPIIQRSPANAIHRSSVGITPSQPGLIQRFLSNQTLNPADGDTGGNVKVKTRKGKLNKQQQAALKDHVKTARQKGQKAVAAINSLASDLQNDTWSNVQNGNSAGYSFMQEFVGYYATHDQAVDAVDKVKQAIVKTQSGLAEEIQIVENTGDDPNMYGYVKKGMQKLDKSTTYTEKKVGKETKKLATYDPTKALKSVSEKKFKESNDLVLVYLPFLGPERPGSIHIQFGAFLSSVGKVNAAHTIFHEATHKFVNSVDHEYGNGLGTGKLPMDQAIENADSLAFFTMNS